VTPPINQPSIAKFVAELGAVLPAPPSPSLQFAWPQGVRRRSVGSLRRACGRKQLDRGFRETLGKALRDARIFCDAPLPHSPVDVGKTLAFCRLPFLPEAEVLTTRFGADFGYGSEARFVEEPDGTGEQFPAKSAVCEDVMQTLLWLHVANFTGEHVTVFARSGREWGIADLMGIDSIGRIHLFELKKHTVTESVANQLTHYLLAHLFEDAGELLRYWKEKFCPAVLDDQVMGLDAYLAAALADERLDTWGPRFVGQTEGRDEAGIAALDRQWATTLSPDAKSELLFKCLRLKVHVRRGVELPAVPSREQFADLAKQWRPKLDPLPELERGPSISVRDRLVLWLVGPRVAGDARERIRQWRRAGLDARWLELDVRPVPASLDWDVRVRREWAPHRSALVTECWPTVLAGVQKWEKRHPEHAGKCSVALDLYDKRRPSETGDEGGTLNAECRAMLWAPGRDPAAIVSVPGRKYLNTGL